MSDVPMGRNELRNLVWDAMVSRAQADEHLHSLLEGVGALAFLELVDAVVDALQRAAGVADPCSR
jgi:hypothetical protein